ncbi:MAG: DNA methyltransferase [Candidatus Saccharibacteria bacterium]|nr:DNA methyltransferase [Candidatus Saccharibacteria bacterium]
MKYLAVLGRQPEISIAELEAMTGIEWCKISFSGRVARARRHGASALILALPRSEIPSKDILAPLDIDRLGGTLKLAIEIEQKPLEYLKNLSEGKITLGVSDYSKNASRKSALDEALKLKKILVRQGRSVRVVENHEAVLSTATSLHNGLNGKNERKVELIKTDDGWYRVIGVQDIEAYARRDQARPARDAKVGMLPPKLAQILINLCGPLKPGSTVLDPFCGTGVVLQEAFLMGYRAYGTDISDRMVEYSKKNLEWLGKFKTIQFEGIRSLARRGQALAARGSRMNSFKISQGDAASFQWEQPIDAVACEGYLGKPFSKTPTEMELKEQQQECGAIVVGFLKNLAKQIKSGTPVVIAVPAWLREDGTYERLENLDLIQNMGYNVNNKTREGLLYHRDGQVVARDILILRKK